MSKGEPKGAKQSNANPRNAVSKSINQLADQMNRIRAYYGFGASRTMRASDILTRYGNNIQSSKAWQDAFNAGKNSPYLGSDENPTVAGYGRADNVKVPQSVYMGTNRRRRR